MVRGAMKIVDQTNGRLAESMRKLDEEKLNELVGNDDRPAPSQTQRLAAMRRRQLGRPAD